MIADGVVERLQAVVDRAVEAADAGVEQAFELMQTVVQPRGDFAGAARDALIEIVDVGLQGLVNVLVRWPIRSTISPPNVFTVRSNSEMWRVISAPSVPLSRANFSASSVP